MVAATGAGLGPLFFISAHEWRKRHARQDRIEQQAPLQHHRQVGQRLGGQASGSELFTAPQTAKKQRSRVRAAYASRQSNQG